MPRLRLRRRRQEPAPAAAAAMASAYIPSVPVFLALQTAIAGDLDLVKCMATMVNMHQVKDKNGQGMLHLAAKNGHLEVCRLLVEELGLDANCISKVGSPVHCAALKGHVEVLRYLLNHGGDPGVLGPEGYSLLLCAVKAGNYQAVRLVLSKGVDVDHGTPPPLLIAALKGQDQVVKILLEHGADPNKFAGVFPPLVMACFAHSLNSMKLLVKAGADVNFVELSGRSILTLIAMGAFKLAEATDDCLIDIVKLLLEAGADPNFVDQEGKIPIMWAAVTGQRELVEILFPKTRPVPSVSDWSVDGIMTTAEDLPLDPAVAEERIADAMSEGNKAFAKGEYHTAAYFYSNAMEYDPSDATFFANRSLCWLRIGWGNKALSDAQHCIARCPDWSKAWYCQGAALSFLEDFKGAVVAFTQALKLDPASDDIKKALREATDAATDVMERVAAFEEEWDAL